MPVRSLIESKPKEYAEVSAGFWKNDDANQNNRLREEEMNNDDKELINILKDIEKQLVDIKYDVADIKNQMPKVPYYGDLLQDIVKAIEDIQR